MAYGIGPIAIGSDAGGSIRIPDRSMALFGLKGSMGRVPLYPGTGTRPRPARRDGPAHPNGR